MHINNRIINSTSTSLIISLTSNTPSPMSFGKSHIATPHGRKWTRLLHVLAVQCPLQTSPITQSSVCYIHTTQMDTRRWHIRGMASHDKNASNLNLTCICRASWTNFRLQQKICMWRAKNQAVLYTPSPQCHQVICEELHSYPSRKEWTRPFRVQLAAQCPKQTSPIIQLWVWHIHNTVPVPHSA